MVLSYSLKEQIKESWTCKNPRCFIPITFGSYCNLCIKLVISKSIPDSIICENCHKEVKIRYLSTSKERKKRYCDVCYKILNRERSLKRYHDIARKKKLYKFLQGNV